MSIFNVSISIFWKFGELCVVTLQTLFETPEEIFYKHLLLFFEKRCSLINFCTCLLQKHFVEIDSRAVRTASEYCEACHGTPVLETAQRMTLNWERFVVDVH